GRGQASWPGRASRTSVLLVLPRRRSAPSRPRYGRRTLREPDHLIRAVGVGALPALGLDARVVQSAVAALVDGPIPAWCPLRGRRSAMRLQGGDCAALEQPL